MGARHGGGVNHGVNATTSASKDLLRMDRASAVCVNLIRDGRDKAIALGACVLARQA